MSGAHQLGYEDADYVGAWLDVARARERLGEPERARAAYAHAWRFLRSSDSVMAPQLREIQDALARLTGEPR